LSHLDGRHGANVTPLPEMLAPTNEEIEELLSDSAPG